MAGVDALVLPKPDSAEWILEMANAVRTRTRKKSFAGMHPVPCPDRNAGRFAKARGHCVGASKDGRDGTGPEDFSAAVGGAPEFDLLLTPNLSVLFAARAAGLLPLGFIGSIGEFSDTHKVREAAVHARRLGFSGALAIHPAQVAIFNEAFSPNAQELEWPRRVVAAENNAATRGLSAFSLNGKMVDPPVVWRAHEILALASNY
ncbi:hypothetical protein NKH63_30765 [Mesorhizobium sp. M0960]|uniref:HpcH/HpaI aldolase/citrate lyase family protein n=1 Tax=Mesorhizobium sp. M0960 TaxID=2957035 RepID=UPI00333A0B0A